MMIRRRIALDVLAVLLLLVATVASAADFRAVDVARELKGAAPGIYAWSFEATVGKSPFDKIALLRLVKGPTPPAHPDAALSCQIQPDGERAGRPSNIRQFVFPCSWAEKSSATFCIGVPRASSDAF